MGGKDLNQVWMEYYGLLVESVSLGIFDIIGHCDLIKVFGDRPEGVVPVVAAVS